MGIDPLQEDKWIGIKGAKILLQNIIFDLVSGCLLYVCVCVCVYILVMSSVFCCHQLNIAFAYTDETLVNSTESTIEDLQSSNNAKLDESCVFVDGSEVDAISSRIPDLKSCKVLVPFFLIISVRVYYMNEWCIFFLLRPDNNTCLRNRYFCNCWPR